MPNIMVQYLREDVMNKESKLAKAILSDVEDASSLEEANLKVMGWVVFLDFLAAEEFLMQQQVEQKMIVPSH